MFEASRDYVKVIKYVQLLSIDEDELKVKMNTYTLIVKGCNLYISYFDKFEIEVSGTINRIEYIYG